MPTFGDESLPPQAFSQCAICHTTAAEGQFRNAPSLSGIVGREIGSMPDYNYSDALEAEKGIWTKVRLDQYLRKPNHAIAGTKMYFRGIPDAAVRTELIDWLAKGNAPTILPPHNDRRKNDQLTEAKIAQDLFRACTRCHSYTEGASAKIGPNLFGVVGRPVASLPEFNYSPKIIARGGIWDIKSLNTFFTEKKNFGQGSHLAFRNLKLKQDRDTLIEFLTNLSPKR